MVPGSFSGGNPVPVPCGWYPSLRWGDTLVPGQGYAVLLVTPTRRGLGYPLPQEQVMLGQVVPQVVRLLQFSLGGLSWYYVSLLVFSWGHKTSQLLGKKAWPYPHLNEELNSKKKLLALNILSCVSLEMYYFKKLDKTLWQENFIFQRSSVWFLLDQNLCLIIFRANHCRYSEVVYVNKNIRIIEQYVVFISFFQYFSAI